MLSRLAQDVSMNIIPRPPIEMVVELCSAYEDMATKNTFLPPFPDDMGAEVSTFANSYANFIADTANCEALGRVFAGQNPDELAYAEDELEKRRKQLRDALRAEFLLEVSKNRPGEGMVRTEARQKFCNRLMEAVDVALTKFAAVISLTNTRFGRFKAVPTCVACDRPLPTRRLKNGGGGSAGEDQKQGARKNYQVPEANENDYGGTQLYERKNTRMNDTTQIPNFTSGLDAPVVRPEVSGTAGTPYVMKAGFKMPANSQSSLMDTTGLTPIQKAFLQADAEPRAGTQAQTLVMAETPQPRGIYLGQRGTQSDTDIHRGKMRPKSASASRGAR